MARSVAIVDDEELIRRSLRLALEAEGFEVAVAGSLAAGRALLSAEPPDVAIVDLRLGDGNGLELVRELRAQSPGAKALVVTAHGDVESAVQALRWGAYDFIKKPFELDEVVTAVRNALAADRLERSVAYLRQREAPEGIVFASEAMKRVLEQVDRLAQQPVPVVLVRGESGTGKERVARALHDRSDRRAGAFVELNCSALPDQLVESELFGHERGAFSDAREQKKGLVELADGGTLFLDEIGDLAPAAQAKLLKFVETHEFRRVGGTRTLKVDCRIVAATHRDLADAARFRPDLYFRLAGVTVELPPLRARPEDVVPLAEHFLRHFAREYRKPLSGFSREALALLRAHPWPGNVRELRAAISSAAIMAEGEVVGAELLEPVRRAARFVEARPEEGIVPLEVVEARYCRWALAQCGGNKVMAAEKLGISRNTLARRVGEADEG